MSFNRFTPTVLEYMTSAKFWADRVIEQTEYINAIGFRGLSVERQISLERCADEIRDRCFKSYLRYMKEEDPRMKYYGARADLYGETPLKDLKNKR